MSENVLCSLTRKDSTSRARARDVKHETARRVGRRGFLQFAAGAVSALVVPDWGQRVFPMFPRTHAVTIHDELHGVVISKRVPWRDAVKLADDVSGFVTASELRAAGWTIEDNGKPLAPAFMGSTRYRVRPAQVAPERVAFKTPPSRLGSVYSGPAGTLLIPRCVFDTGPDGHSEWTCEQEAYAGGIILGNWRSSADDDGSWKHTVVRGEYRDERARPCYETSWREVNGLHV